MVCMALEGWRVTADRPEVSYGFRKPVFNWVGVEGVFIHSFTHSFIHVYKGRLLFIILIFK